MNPLEILAAYGLTAEGLASLNPYSTAILELYNVVNAAFPGGGANLSFYRQFLDYVPGSTIQQAYTAFRAARYWSSYEAAFALLNPDMPMSRSMARFLPAPTTGGGTGQNYRYNVEVTVRWPNTGDVQVYNTWLYSLDMLTIGQIQEKAWDRITGPWRMGSTPLSQGGAGPELAPTYDVVDYVAFTMG